MTSMWNVAHRQPGFPGKNPRKMIRILTGFASKFICFYFSKNCKLYFFMFSGPLGRQTKLDLRAEIGQETMALSVLSPDK